MKRIRKVMSKANLVKRFPKYRVTLIEQSFVTINPDGIVLYSEYSQIF